MFQTLRPFHLSRDQALRNARLPLTGCRRVLILSLCATVVYMVCVWGGGTFGGRGPTLVRGRGQIWPASGRNEHAETRCSPSLESRVTLSGSMARKRCAGGRRRGRGREAEDNKAARHEESEAGERLSLRQCKAMVAEARAGDGADLRLQLGFHGRMRGAPGPPQSALTPP